MKKQVRLIVQILISLGLLTFLLWRTDFSELRARLDVFRPGFILAILALFSLDRALMAYKWRLLLLVKGLRIPFLETVKVYYFSTFIGLFLPVTVGSDFVRGFKLFKDGHQGTDVAASIILERFLGFVASALAATLCSLILLLGFGLRVDLFCWMSLGALATLAAAFVVSLHMDWVRRWTARRGKWLALIEKLYDSYSHYRRNDRMLWIFLALSFVEQFFPVVVTWCAAQSLQVDIPFVIFMVVVPLVQLIARLPISMHGIGVIEGMLAFLLTQLGYSLTHAVAIGLVGELAGALATLPGMFCDIRTKERETPSKRKGSDA